MRLRQGLYLAAVLSVLPLLAAGCAKPAAPDVVLRVQMKKYEFDPPEIRVRQGQVVRLEITSADVQHGFDIPSLGISESVQPGHTAVVTFRAERRGEHVIECGIICGARHDDMKGRLIIE